MNFRSQRGQSFFLFDYMQCRAKSGESMQHPARYKKNEINVLLFPGMNTSAKVKSSTWWNKVVFEFAGVFRK